MTVGSPPPLSFRPERSGVEKSHSEIVQGLLRWEILGLRVSIEYKTVTFIPTCSPARNDSSRDAAPTPFCFFLKCLYAARRPCHFDRSEAKWRNLTPRWYSPWRQEISRLRVSIEYKTFTLIPACSPARNDSRREQHLCHSVSFRNVCTQPAAPVISTGAGQPPIGKPLIGQARGQLRLTWRLYAESPQSGEISLRDGTLHDDGRFLESEYQ